MSTPFEYIDASGDTGTKYNVVPGRVFFVKGADDSQRLYTISRVVLNEGVWCIADLRTGLCTVVQGEDAVEMALRRLGAIEVAESLDVFCARIGEVAVELARKESVDADGSGDE